MQEEEKFTQLQLRFTGPIQFDYEVIRPVVLFSQSTNSRSDVAPAPGGTVWYTAQTKGELGRLDPASGRLEVLASPRGRGPYGSAAAPDGTVYYASLAGSYVGRLDTASGEATVLEPPTPGQGARRKNTIELAFARNSDHLTNTL